MVYRVQIFKFLSSIGDHIYRVKRAEKITNLIRTSILLILTSAIIYGWMASLGIGSNIISTNSALLGESGYELSKFWFMIGRALYGAIFAAIILFVPGLLFYLFTEIPYQKLIVMQQVVLIVILLERLIWIPLVVFVGLDWYASPLSLGIIFSYLLEVDWFIYFFGAISLFQIWIIWFQYRVLHGLSGVKKSTLWISILLLHVFGWVLAAMLATTDLYIVSGWFG